MSEWISLGEAAKLLGVHPTTVRNWADQGDLPFRRTAGRHRRFNRSVLEAWAAENKVEEKPVAPVIHNRSPQVLVEYALGHTRFSVGESDIHHRSWYERLSPQGVENSRKFGRRLLEALMHHLEDKYDEGEELAVARRLGEEYAHMLRDEGLSLAQVVQGFVYFDDFLIESVVQMMAPNMTSSPSEWSDLLRQINAFTNELLVALIEHYQTE